MTLADTGLACPECRGPLQLIDLAHVCPICGLFLVDAVDLKAVDMATGLIAADVVCATCQYNLRTIPIGSVCPECGTAVTKSLTRDGLRWANAEWLRRTRFGLGVLAIACAVGLLDEIYSQVSQRFWSMGTEALKLHFAISLVISIVSLTTWCVGCVAVTHPENPQQPQPFGGRNRLLRICAFASAILCGLMWTYPLLRFLWIEGWTRLRTSSIQEVYYAPSGTSAIDLLIMIGYSGSAIAGAFLLNLILRSLADRAGRTALRKILTFLFVPLVINSLASIAMRVIVVGFSSSQAWSDYTMWRMAHCTASCSNLPIGIITLIACLRLRGRLGQVLRGRLNTGGS